MSVSSAFWAVSLLGSSSTHLFMFDLPNTEATPLLALMPSQGKPDGYATGEIEDPGTRQSSFQAFLPIALFQHSRYFSTESWLLSEQSAAQAFLSLTRVSEPTFAQPTVDEVLPLALADTLESWATFVQGTLPEVPKVTEKPFPQPVSQLGTVEDWVAIADVRIVPTTQDPSHSPLDDPLLARCTDLYTIEGTDQQTNQPASRFQIWLRDHHLGDVQNLNRAESIAQVIRQLLQRSDLDPNWLQPAFAGVQPTVKLGDDVLFSIDDSMAKDLGYGPEWAAVAWTNRLRQAIGASPLDAGTLQMALEGFEESDMQFQGTASWYGPYFHGRLTATGETFDQNQLTVAHKSLPFNTYLKVRNLRNNRTVVVRVNDRGPYIGKRSLDLSKAAAQCLGSEQVGVIPYEAVILKDAIDVPETLALSPDAALSADNN